jgi:hypothetical protein
MAMVVLLMPAGGHHLVLEAEAAGRLGGLGVTHVSVLQDEETVAVVLEGWAFDPQISAGLAAALVSGGSRPVRTLRPLAHVAVSGASPPEGDPMEVPVEPEAER